jgi:hypothetical protein
MVDFTAIRAVVDTLPAPVRLSLIVTIFILTILIATNLFTTLRCNLWLWRHQHLTQSNLIRPPKVPYTIPILGHALYFLTPGHARIWSYMASRVPPSIGAATLRLAGTDWHILSSPSAIAAMFKQKSAKMHFRTQALGGICGMSQPDLRRFYQMDAEGGATAALERQWKDVNIWFFKKEGVDVLTAEFMRHFTSRLAHVKDDEEVSISLLEWIYPIMMSASVDGYFGSKLLEIYPDCVADYTIFEKDFTHLFFGAPRFLIPNAYKYRQRLLDGLERYIVTVSEETKGIIPPPDGPPKWDSYWGSPANRARHRYYNSVNLTTRGRASESIGLLLATNSNAIPATV